MTDQERVAIVLFEWWWGVDPLVSCRPLWDSCTPEVQAFWMDGAYRIGGSTPPEKLGVCTQPGFFICQDPECPVHGMNGTHCKSCGRKL
jgi:hypothetical protein